MLKKMHTYLTANHHERINCEKQHEKTQKELIFCLPLRENASANVENTVLVQIDIDVFPDDCTMQFFGNG